MSEEKKTDHDRVTLKNETLRKYFPKSYTPKQMEDTIIKLLEGWYKKRQDVYKRQLYHLHYTQMSPSLHPFPMLYCTM